jgi:hypothetical protein
MKRDGLRQYRADWLGQRKEAKKEKLQSAKI